MLALALEPIFQYSAVVDRLRAMVDPPTACHRQVHQTTSLFASTMSARIRDVTPPTTQLPESRGMSRQSSQSQSLPQPRTRQHVQSPRLSRPAKDSLYDLLHQHPELDPYDTPLPENIRGSPPSKGHMRPSRSIMSLSDALTEILLPEAVHPVLSSNAIKTVVSTLWPAAFNRSQLLPELHIFFGDRVYRDAVRTQVMWNFPGESTKSSQSSFKSISTRPADSYGISHCSTPASHNPASLPMMCYIGKNQLASMRKNLFRIAPGPGRSWNGPVFRLQQLRSKALIPANSDHDSHFIAIFLAMAQRHFYGAPAPSNRRDSQWCPLGGKPRRPDFQDIKLRILTHDNETSDFIVYTGHVTAKFLDRFHDPLKAPRGDDKQVPGINIEYARVPIWPILGLRERLGKALGEEVVGPFDPMDMETWEDDAGEVREPSHKRKREALSEVLNGSFDEDTDGEQHHSPINSKKRRLGQGSPVGVVV